MAGKKATKDMFGEDKSPAKKDARQEEKRRESLFRRRY